jgi:hypothetical protein
MKSDMSLDGDGFWKVILSKGARAGNNVMLAILEYTCTKQNAEEREREAKRERERELN